MPFDAFKVSDIALHIIKRFAEEQLGKDAEPFIGPLSDLIDLGLQYAIQEALNDVFEAPGLEFESDLD
jgi:hypothetical protein